MVLRVSLYELNTPTMPSNPSLKSDAQQLKNRIQNLGTHFGIPDHGPAAKEVDVNVEAPALLEVGKHYHLLLSNTNFNFTASIVEQNNNEIERDQKLTNLTEFLYESFSIHLKNTITELSWANRETISIDMENSAPFAMVAFRHIINNLPEETLNQILEKSQTLVKAWISKRNNSSNPITLSLDEGTKRLEKACIMQILPYLSEENLKGIFRNYLRMSITGNPDALREGLIEEFAKTFAGRVQQATQPKTQTQARSRSECNPQ